ncbi:hypothetical protein N6H18_11540 [Reichenbachiella agarivorans]|uniref:Tetratricopeptide repeat-containing protein n=1 Tax=Reichenbachiella agarivorans TaxID=2979464 RepID=A0ABY6CND5_9BACT|nr:hypothetical protein [Reichenbachiella agarivorans]UXP30983.1 hypothetical protein N6H18_11540 [Reichenbachiella agarivorans]
MLLFKLSQNKFLKKQDTLMVIDCLTELSDLYAHNGNFSSSYDGYWEALLLAEHTSDILSKSKVYQGLGWLYILYQRDEQAILYFNHSLDLKRKHIKELGDNREIFIPEYYALASLYRKRGQYEMAKTYLDSCTYVKTIISEEPFGSAFITAERGYILYYEGKSNEALRMLLPLNDHLSTQFHSYLVMYHYFLAMIYQNLNEYQLSDLYFNSAIKAGQLHKSHADLLPDVYEHYSELLMSQGKAQKAYEMLKKAKEQTEMQFGSRSKNNKFLLEIKDEFRISKEKQAAILKEQKIRDLEQEEKIWVLRSYILYGTIGFLITLIFLTYRFFRSKYKAKKHLLDEKRQLERQKMREVLEVKNKELTASALQVIQREETLGDLKRQLNEQKENPDKSKLSKLAKSINTTTSNDWKEFEARFISVNKRFYKELHNRYPDLSQSDKKICALVKLNFSSKDMAKLLGISVESVHTTRYRLRKKMNLERSENLEDIIASIE